MIYHITSYDQWQAQKTTKHFIAESLQSEGFIHAWSYDQIPGVLERYFKARIDLIILEVDERMLTSILKYESGPTGELFPHIYGAIDTAAVVSTERV